MGGLPSVQSPVRAKEAVLVLGMDPSMSADEEAISQGKDNKFEYGLLGILVGKELGSGDGNWYGNDGTLGTSEQIKRPFEGHTSNHQMDIQTWLKQVVTI